MKKHTDWCTDIYISLCARADRITLRILKKKNTKTKLSCVSLKLSVSENKSVASGGFSPSVSY